LRGLPKQEGIVTRISDKCRKREIWWDGEGVRIVTGGVGFVLSHPSPERRRRLGHPVFVGGEGGQSRGFEARGGGAEKDLSWVCR
jgi:hypothetical protein